MDIRVKKTRRSIINAFLELRTYQPLEKITVTELCEKAEVNKSTFYKHYADIFDLSNQLEEETIEQILANLPHPEYILGRPREFTEEMLTACLSQSVVIEKLFSGSQSGQLILKLNDAIKTLVFKFYPQWQDIDAVNIYLTYAIFGGYYAMYESKTCSDALTVEVISRIVEKSAEVLWELSPEGTKKTRRTAQ